jgi:perosamine synthetase
VISMGGPAIGFREKVAVWRQMSSGQLAQGAKVKEFEDKFAAWGDYPHSIALNSGTSALHLGMLAMGIGPDDEVIVPSFSFAASANSVALTGAKPVFCDIEDLYFTIDPAHIPSLITPATKAIMAVHLYGQMANMAEIRAIALHYGLAIIEDAAQAHGAQLDGIASGRWGKVGAFSFYPTKNMTTGEGGIVVTDDPSVDRKVRLLRNQGMERRYENEVIGFNNRMTEIAAAIGIEQLRRLDRLTLARQKNAEQLAAYIEDIDGLITPAIRPNSTHVFHQFTVRVPERRDILSKFLTDNGISHGVYYPTPIHRLPSFLGTECDLPVTDKMSKEVLSLPIHPKLSKDNLATIAKTLARGMRH